MKNARLKARLERETLGNELREQQLRARKLALVQSAFDARAKGTASRYDNATRTRLRPGPRAAGGSAQSHLSRGNALGMLRRDCQDLERNSTAARMLVRRVQQMLIADGAIITSTSPNAGWNTLFDDRFRAWADASMPELLGHPDIRRRHSLWELLACAIGAFGTSGDELWILTRSGQVQAIEGERLVTPGFAASIALDGGGSIVEGVELDAYGAAVAYHVGEWDLNGVLRAEPSRVRRVRGEFARLLISPLGPRTGMVRGEPFLQAVVERIERLDNYEEKTAVAAEIATLFGGIVKTESPAQLQADMEASVADQTAPAGTPREISLEPGALQFIENAGEITQIKPEFPTTNYRDYVLHQLMMMGAELGLPLVSLCFEATQLSWSNIKALYALSQRCLEPAQASIERTIRWVRAFKARQWMAEGLIPSIDDFERCEIAMPLAPVVDFRSEVEGYRVAIEQNLMTQDDATQRLGTGRAADIRARRQAEREDERARGIVPPTTPGAVSADTAADEKQEEAP